MPTYTEETMRTAVSAVRQKQLGIRKAAAEYGVPKSSLSDHVNGKSILSSTRGPDRQLTDEEETALVNYMTYMANQGFPMTRAMIRCYVQEIVKKSDRQTKFNASSGPSDKWFRSFLKRHQELSERNPEQMDRARTSMSNQKVIDDFFEFFGELLKKYDLKDESSRIFNCDETGWSGKEVARTKVIGPKHGHIIRQKVSSTDHVTAHLCVCADGRFMPSMIIFQGGLPHRKFTKGMPDTWLYAYSESGYMDGDLFHKWFINLFIPNCGTKRPVMLVMDNHDSHITLPVIEAAIANDIVLVGFPGHTTHILQPLDVKIIGPLKLRLSSLATHLGFVSPKTTIGKAKFPLLIKSAIDRVTSAAVQEAFEVTGICPLKPDEIDKSQLIPATFDDSIGESSTAAATTEDTVHTCETCGSFLINPLVRQGLIPESMADILVPPPTTSLNKNKKKNKRVVAEGRVISGEQIVRQLKEKEIAENLKREEQLKRGVEREQKKEQKKKDDEEKIIKRKKREEDMLEKREGKRLRAEKMERERIKRAVGGKLADKVYTCGKCSERGRVNDEQNGIMWYGCDEKLCRRWFHFDCLSGGEKEFLRESLDGEAKWFCKTCKPWLYVEE